MSAILSGKKLYLTGGVGEDLFGEDAFGSIDVLLALESLQPTDRLTVHINSPGGYTDVGVAIYAMLAAHPGGVDVVVDGMAASAGSFIAMAGDKISMSLGSVMMIHDPSVHTYGNSEKHGKSIEYMEATANALAEIYARKSGKSAAVCRQLMKDETWYTPEEAIAAGFADEVSAPTRGVTVAAFDYTTFMHAPERLVALAREKNWTASKKPAPKPQPRKDRKMPNDKQAHAAATARIRAIMKADEAEGRADLAEHLAYETELEPEAAIALMKAAPVASSSSAIDDAENYRPRRTMNGQGLNRPHSEKPNGGSRLVAAMKQRHGVK